MAKGGARRILPNERADQNLAKFLEGTHVPNIAYHGTTKDFSAFKPGRSWFTHNKDYANIYGGPDAENFGLGGNIMPLHVSIKNPKMFPASNEGRAQWAASENDANLKRKGHDGVLFLNDDGSIATGYALHPHQIKSAIGNRGTYDPRKADITKADGGDVSVTQVKKRKDDKIPELESAAKALLQGLITRVDYDKVVNRVKPVKPYESIPRPASDEEALGALHESKRPKWRCPPALSIRLSC
jgi:hypothetical protein